MPQVPRIAPKYVSPPGYEVFDTDTATEIILPGQLVKVGASGISKLAAGQLDADGVSPKEYYAGEPGCDYLVQGEMAGYDLTGITPGTPLYPSATVAGNLQTEVVASAPIRMKALRNGRVRFNFV